MKDQKKIDREKKAEETKGLVKSITEKISKDLKDGDLPWEAQYCANMPRNFSSKTPYSGINIFILWAAQEEFGFKQSWWGTAKQVERLKGTIKDDATSVEIVFMKPYNTTNARGEDKKIMLSNSFHLYNIEQTEGLERIQERIDAKYPKGKLNFDDFPTIEAVLKEIPYELSQADGFTPSYGLTTDRIRMPLKTNFESEVAYYSTLFHELVHWTGAKHRLKRPQNGARCKVTLVYAFEELVAEMGAAFMCAHFGFKYQTRHAAYIQGYISHLNDDPKALQKAAAKGYKAMDFLLDFSRLPKKKRPKKTPVCPLKKMNDQRFPKESFVVNPMGGPQPGSEESTG